MTSSESPSGTSPQSAGLHERPLSSDDFVVLNDEIRMFVRAGIPLDVGLHGTSGRTRGRLAKLTSRLAQRLEAGAALQEAIAAEGTGLPRAYQAVLESGARTGRLDEVLSSVSELAESTASLRRQLVLSTIYPAAVVTLALTLFGFFLAYVLPQIERTYVVFDLHRSVWIDRLLQLRQAVPWESAAVGAAALLVLLIGLFVVMRAASGGAIAWTPGAREIALARLARVMSLLVEHQIPLPEACRLSGEASGNAALSQAANDLALEVERGQTLPEALEVSPQLPPLLRWLIAVGDRQSSLAGSLRQAADVYEVRAIVKMNWFRRIVPPLAVILCCGSITLVYGLMLFLPVAEMLEQLGVG